MGYYEQRAAQVEWLKELAINIARNYGTDGIYEIVAAFLARTGLQLCESDRHFLIRQVGRQV